VNLFSEPPIRESTTEFANAFSFSGAVIAAFVFGLGGSEIIVPTASIVASNYPDTPGPDMSIKHKGGDILKGSEWKLSIVEVGQPALFKTSNLGADLSIGKQIKLLQVVQHWLQTQSMMSNWFTSRPMQ
jgi:hypothetical protein